MIAINHAKERIRERFNVKEGDEQAFVDRHFPKSSKVCDTVNDKDQVSSLYVTGDIIFVVCEERRFVITVTNRKCKVVSNGAKSFRSKVQAFIKEEIANITALGGQLERQADDLDEAIREELSELQVQLKRTRSMAKKLAIKGRIMALDERFDELPTDIREIRSNIRKQVNGALAHY
jgi:hypothetical protein